MPTEKNLSQFIECSQIPPSVCDDLLKLYEESNDKTNGVIVKNNGENAIDINIKCSMQVSIPVNTQANAALNYFSELQKSLLAYVDKYPYCNGYAPFSILENIALVKWPKNTGGFKIFHTERCSASLPNASRHLVFMTYLNDINEGGETEFFHQNLKVKPKKGLTLIWPADWTFTHKGNIAPHEDKYIITGWFSYF